MSQISPEPLDGYVPPPYLPPATLDERLVMAWRAVTRTPGRAALATLDACAVAAFLISLRPIPVTTADAAGPLRASCGVGFYLGGASNRAVDSACRFAYGSRMPALLLLGLVVVGTTGLLIRSLRRDPDEDQPSRLWGRLSSSPALAALAAFELAAVVAVVAAAQPVAVTTTDAAGALRAHCGLQYFIVGVGNAAVRQSCRRAYGSRAAVFFVLLAVVAAGAFGLWRTTIAADRRVSDPDQNG
jgi:hypothetical protein